MGKRKARFYSAQGLSAALCSLLLRRFGYMHHRMEAVEKFLGILMKNLWKKLDFHLLFVRYSFIMNPRLILEESALG